MSPSIPRGQRRRAGESHPKTGVSQADCNDCCFHDPLLLNGLGFDLTLQQDRFPCDFLNVGAAGFYSPFRFCTRICKPLRFWRVLSFWQIGPPPQPLLWKCGNPRSVRVPKLRGQREDLRVSTRFSALGASFPQQALDFVAFRTGCICEPVIRLQCTPFRKPRRMRTSPDSCTEPFFIVLVKDSEIHDCLILFDICLIS